MGYGAFEQSRALATRAKLEKCGLSPVSRECFSADVWPQLLHRLYGGIEPLGHLTFLCSRNAAGAKKRKQKKHASVASGLLVTLALETSRYIAHHDTGDDTDGSAGQPHGPVCHKADVFHMGWQTEQPGKKQHRSRHGNEKYAARSPRLGGNALASAIGIRDAQRQQKLGSEE